MEGDMKPHDLLWEPRSSSSSMCDQILWVSTLSGWLFLFPQWWRILSVEGVDGAKAFSAKQGELHETRFRFFKFSVTTLLFDAVEHAPCSDLHATLQ